jgi:thioredoxin reductase (NADPH)
MSKPTMLAVDDDPQVLASISRDLRSRYAGEYRIIRALLTYLWVLERA